MYILGKHINENRTLYTFLISFFGINRQGAYLILNKLGLPKTASVNSLSKKQVRFLDYLIQQQLMVEFNLRKTSQIEYNSLISGNAYRSYRHKLGYPVRGQRTHTNAKNTKRSKQN